MACDAQSLINAATTAGLFKLSQRDLKEATLYALCSGAAPGTSAQVLIVGAKAAGYEGYSDEALDAAILTAICQGPP